MYRFGRLDIHMYLVDWSQGTNYPNKNETDVKGECGCREG
jgi:hypothetical protein